MSSKRDHDTLRAAWLADYNHPFAGWDFSYLDGRRITIRPLDTWDYTVSVVAAIGSARSMLDMDTGGGELLANLPMLAPQTCATERYAPNVQVARHRLEPLGIAVYEVAAGAPLPFADGAFALVTNRHGSYSPQELCRVLEPGGMFITQQVGSQTNSTLRELLDAPQPTTSWDLASAVSELEVAGFQILESREEFPITRYLDVGAIAYYLKAIPWEVPDFSVDRSFDKLIDIHAQTQADGYVDVLFHQFFIRAQR